MNFDLKAIKDLIISVGFPIVVTIYLLVYFRKTLDALKDSINANTNVLGKICEHLNIPSKDKNG